MGSKESIPERGKDAYIIDLTPKNKIGNEQESNIYMI